MWGAKVALSRIVFLLGVGAAPTRLELCLLGLSLTESMGELLPS